jgi:hypothetical protein
VNPIAFASLPFRTGCLAGLVLALAEVATAQARMPNEGCSAPAVSPPLGSHGDAGSCSSSATQFLDAGRGDMVIDTYGGQTRGIPMPVVDSGLIGLGNLYHSQFVVDMSASAWSGTGTHLRSADTTYDLPVPWMNAGDLDGGGYAVQPRPGTMPGLYILQVGNNFYHYGSPLDSGANPQTTAVYLEGYGVDPQGDAQQARARQEGRSHDPHPPRRHRQRHGPWRHQRRQRVRQREGAEHQANRVRGPQPRSLQERHPVPPRRPRPLSRSCLSYPHESLMRQGGVMKQLPVDLMVDVVEDGQHVVLQWQGR